MEKPIQYMFKIILIGDSGVGKTSLMTRYTDMSFIKSPLSTIGVDFKIRTIDVDDTRVKLQIWDTAGQERFRAMVSNYYRGAHGIFIVFDMTCRASFEHLGEWIAELQKKDAWNTGEVIILGNKIDEKEGVCVGEDEIAEFLDRYKISKASFVPVSAKDDVGVNSGFYNMTKQLIARFGAEGAKASVAKKPMLGRGGSRRSCC